MAAIKKTTKKQTTKKKIVKKKSTIKKNAPKKSIAKKKNTVTKKKVAKKSPAKKKTLSKKATPKKKTAVKKATSKSKASLKKVAPKKKTAVKKVTSKKKSAVKKIAAKNKLAINKTRRTIGTQKPEFTPYKIKKNEEYMNETQLEHFRDILNNWKRQLLDEVNRTVNHMKEDASNFADPADRATQEEEFALELRTRDRERKLLRKIDAALQRIDAGTYGYCEETGEEIGIQRLEVRPVATLCLEAQERHEVNERLYRNLDD